MNRTFNFFKLFALLLLFATPACVDLEFDEPPVIAEGVDLVPTHTIADLKALYTGTLTPVAQDMLIGGVVIADDRSGNFFRSLIIQDASGGIEIRINLTNAYNYYPVGREVFIQCNGLVLGNYNGVMQLGGYIYEEDGAPQLGDIIDVRDRLQIGQSVGEPAPMVRTISELNQINPATISTLVKLENVEFTTTDRGKPFADAFGRTSVNRTITDCSGNSIVLRSSGYATFASDLTPEGNGEVVAVYSVFGTTPQLYIRNLEDIVMDGERCTGASGNEELISVAEIRQSFTGGVTTAPAGKKIKGVVISDDANGNIDGRNLVLQDGDAGIVVRFQDFHDFELGDEIEVVVSNQELSEYNGLLQVNRVSNELAVSLGKGTPPAPREATVGEILSNAEAWESTLVLVKGAELTGGTYSGSVDVSDGTGTITMFTRNSATFADESLPASADLTAIVSQFNDPQIVIRNLDDVEAGNGNTGGGGGGDTENISLADLRALFPGQTTTAPANRKIKGVVISDRINENLTGRNLVLQDETGGIVVRFTATHSIDLGQELEVDISGLELSEYNGLLQVNNVPLEQASVLGQGALPTPRTATVQEIIENVEAWESTLVKIEGVTLSGSNTYSGVITVTDASGNIDMYTRSQASFSGDAIPSGQVTLTAIVSQFNDPQVIIRNLEDVKTD